MRSFTKAALLLTTVTMTTSGLWLVACGDDDSGDLFGQDGGDGSTTQPPGNDSGGGGNDAGDGGPCATEGASCYVNGTIAGLCKAGACTPCADPADDNACKNAYGAAFGGSSVCDKGVCVPGDCHTNAQCTGGKICGLAQPDTCGACSSDAECKTSYGSAFYCNTTTGGCVSSTCANGDGGTCPGAAKDICCGGAGGAVCSSGNCCSDAQCTQPKTCVKAAGATAGVCTGCAPVADGNYYVDPSVADDAAATGGATCPFNSITHALAFLGVAQAAAVNVVVVTGTTTFGAKETFPIIVPVNVTIKSQATAVPATLQVPAGAKGFVLGSPTSSVQYLIVDGQGGKGTIGVEAITGSSSTTTTLSNVVVHGFATDGIQVRNASGVATGGGLAIGPGVMSTNNSSSGLHVLDNGVAVVTGNDAAKTQFDANGAGIFVEGAGQLTVNGAIGATPPGTGTVTANGNAKAGLSIGQTPPAAGAPPTNAVTGLTAWNTTAGDGIVVLGGSSLTLRSSSVLGNSANGVHVKYFVGAGGAHVNTTLYVDLGTALNGKNVLQAPAGSKPNTGAGICLEIDQNAGGLVRAEGNTFVTAPGPGGNPAAASADCSTAAVPPKQLSFNKGNGACAGGVSVGIIANAATSNDVDVQACTK